jgi:hypothetical protein
MGPQAKIVEVAVEILRTYHERARLDAEREIADDVLAAVDRSSPNPAWTRAVEERSRILDVRVAADAAFDRAVGEMIKALRAAGSL